MDINKSVSILCAKKKCRKQDLAAHMKITAVYLSMLLRKNSSSHIEKMAAFFDMTVSDFIKEGE
jgi:DNA-binding Xre family transcriptional regulator